MRHRSSKLVFNGVTYRVRVTVDNEDRTTIQFETSHPPQGLDSILYRWEGRTSALRAMEAAS